jgi:hypothetical protein
VTDDMKRLTDALEAARKKLGIGGKQANGAEAVYAEAYAAMCRLDPIRFRPVRGKRR